MKRLARTREPRIERALRAAAGELEAAVGPAALPLLLAGLIGIELAQRRLQSICRRKRAADAVNEFLAAVVGLRWGIPK